MKKNPLLIIIVFAFIFILIFGIIAVGFLETLAIISGCIYSLIMFASAMLGGHMIINPSHYKEISSKWATRSVGVVLLILIHIFLSLVFILN